MLRTSKAGELLTAAQIENTLFPFQFSLNSSAYAGYEILPKRSGDQRTERSELTTRGSNIANLAPAGEHLSERKGH